MIKFFKRLKRAYKIVRDEDFFKARDIPHQNVTEEPLTMAQASKLAREQEADAIRAINDYEEYR